jgi:hypothetical protein
MSNFGTATLKLREKAAVLPLFPRASSKTNRVSVWHPPRDEKEWRCSLVTHRCYLLIYILVCQ